MGANTTPFSIRNYVLSVRDEDIYRNWPFHDKHLQFCMKLGISRVLPPFESHDSMRKNHSNNRNHEVGLNHAKEVKNICSFIQKPNVVVLDRKEEPMMARHDHIDKSVTKILHQSSNPKDNASNHMDKVVAAATTTAMLRYKRKKRKFKPKMRSMVDICAEARPCTLEDLDRIVQSKLVASRSLRPFTDNHVAMESDHIAKEVNESMVTMDYHDYSCMAKETSNWKTKQPRDEVGINDKDVFDKKRHLMKIKLNRCSSKPQKRFSSIIE